MPHPNFFILYVRDAVASAAFYQDLLGVVPVEASAHFALFPLESGVQLGLWDQATVNPAVTAPAGGSEVAFAVVDVATVMATYARWQQLGLPILQAPGAEEYGYTFLAADPDGHRLRVFAPGAA